METHLPFGSASTLSATLGGPDLTHSLPPSLSSSHNYLIKQIPLAASEHTKVATLSTTGHSLSNLQIIWNAYQLEAGWGVHKIKPCL